MNRTMFFFAMVFTSLSLSGETSLQIPAQLLPVYGSDGVARYELTASAGTSEFIPGLITPTMGYSGDYLGPTIRVRKGDRVEVSVKNELSEVTTVHWHGLYVPAESDGGPHQTVAPGDVWKAKFTVSQQAATLWYHPHPIGQTGAQVYAGLSGLLIIDDDAGEELSLPSSYGIDDIPLIIQDRRFSKDGRFVYAQSMPDVIRGIEGEVLLVNGTQQPVAAVPRGVVRLRILNGSDMNVFRMRFSNDAEFFQIATDGGFINAPLARTTSVIATGERVELLIDTSKFPDGKTSTLIVDDYFGRTFDAVAFRVDSSIHAEYRSMSEISTQLNRIDAPVVEAFGSTRLFAMRTMGAGGRLTINGRHMDLNRIDFRIPAGTREIWEVTNESRGMMAVPHTFHIHNGQFRLIDVNGKSPPPELSGWKDTFLLLPNDRIRIAVQFEKYTGIYMYHCHFLVHEDAGMMGQFEVFE